MYKVLRARSFLRAFSAIILVTGLVLLCMPIWTILTLWHIRKYVGTYSWLIPTCGVMIIGLCIVLNSLLGLISELKKNIWLLIIFLKLLIYWGLISIVVGLSMIYFLATVPDNVEKYAYKVYFPEPNNNTADELHYYMGCCGYYNFTDYNIYFGYEEKTAPISCCTSVSLTNYGYHSNPDAYKNRMCIDANIGKEYLEDDGCYTTIKDNAYKHGSLILILAIGFGVFWLASVVFLVYNLMLKDDPIYLVEIDKG